MGATRELVSGSRFVALDRRTATRFLVSGAAETSKVWSALLLPVLSAVEKCSFGYTADLEGDTRSAREPRSRVQLARRTSRHGLVHILKHRGPSDKKVKAGATINVKISPPARTSASSKGDAKVVAPVTHGGTNDEDHSGASSSSDLLVVPRGQACVRGHFHMPCLSLLSSSSPSSSLPSVVERGRRLVVARGRRHVAGQGVARRTRPKDLGDLSHEDHVSRT
ncbi:hypothetical protein DMC30DRAFT_133786 [Rhodotorula diobovata]|uniref:Uncharacterized protein n=1 Tax=Rhodotorula diobovata TaxID=5288 RepID=A0A5C5FKH3_9BASI|nr:hypothetical protein DMC30DRAFT_133786 [Rhodotorula diobovata]